MKKATRILATLLALMLVFTGSALAEIPAYLNVGQVPLVSEPITLSLTVQCKEETTAPKETYVYRYITEYVGLDIDLDYFYPSTRNESIMLMMAGGDLPDVIIGAKLTDIELMNYGANEGLLLDLAPYINEENAPNFTYFYSKMPQYRNAVSLADGRIYSLGGVTDPDREEDYDTQNIRMFYNWDLLERLNLEVPTTLDELLEVLRAIKKDGDATGKAVVPFGGNSARYNPTYLIMNALGYNVAGSYSNQKGYETQIALRNGEIVLPCFDKEPFTKYLEFMHTLYSEGLMEQDFYTLDKDTTKAHLAADMYAIFPEVPALYTSLEYGAQWFGGIPLTSEFNDTPFWPTSTEGGIGTYVVSAKTEMPELCMAFADLMISPEYGKYFGHVGPSVNDTDMLMGITSGWYLNENLEMTYDSYLENKDKYSALNYYQYETFPLWMPGLGSIRHIPGNGFGKVADENDVIHTMIELPEGNDLKELSKSVKSAQTLDLQYQLSQLLSWGQYLAEDAVPAVFYFDEDTLARITELKSLITEYASQEIARFVIGERDLSTVDAFYAELERLGAAEYVGYYADYYAALKG